MLTKRARKKKEERSRKVMGQFQGKYGAMIKGIDQQREQ